jgi:uncharacterized membrane protein (DUF106 family)
MVDLITLIQSNPRTSIVIIACLITLATTLVTYFFTDKEKMRSMKEKQKAIQAEMKKHKDNPQKMMELNKKMLEDFPEQMRHMFKPLLITFIPLIFIFAWLRGTFTTTVIKSTWIWWYIIISIIASTVYRKLFKMP